MKKKLLSVLLSIVILLCMAAPAFAVDYLGGDITIHKIKSSDMAVALSRGDANHPVSVKQYGNALLKGKLNDDNPIDHAEKIGAVKKGTLIAHCLYKNALKLDNAYYDMEVKVTATRDLSTSTAYLLSYCASVETASSVPYLRSFFKYPGNQGNDIATVLVTFHYQDKNSTPAYLPNLAYGNTCWVKDYECFKIQDHDYDLYATDPTQFKFDSSHNGWFCKINTGAAKANTLWSYSQNEKDYNICQISATSSSVGSGAEVLFGYYTGDKGSVTTDAVTVNKVVNGTGTGDFTFNFTPCDASGNVLPAAPYTVDNPSVTATCSAGTTSDIGPIGGVTYKLAGTYYNLISEEAEDGWNCDTTKYIQKVVVKQNKATLVIEPLDETSVSYSILGGGAVTEDDLKFTNSLKDYSVSYKFEGKGPDKPAPVDGKIYHWHDSVTVDTTFVEGDKVEGTKDGVPGTWTFKGWTPDENLTENGVEGDVLFIGTWEFTEKTYSVTYKFRGDVPDGVTAPTDDGEYKWHNSVVTDKTYQKDDEKVVDHGKWVFKGWIANDNLTPNGVEGDVEFVGEWEYIPDTYTVTYQFDGDAPADVTAPEDTNKYSFHDEVTVDSTYKKDDVIVGMKDGVKGKWIFTGWETDENINSDGLIEDDAVITGRWAFDHDKYNVVYEFEGDIPAGVVAPVDEKEYKWHDDVKVDKTYKVDDEIKGEKDGVPGTWKFSGWTADENITEDGIENNAKFTGKWGFDGDVYTVKYEFAGEVPADVKAPVDEAEYKWHDGVETDDTYKPGDSIDAVKDGVPGKWVFEGWTPDDNLTENGIEGDVVFTGEWKFVPDTYSVTYEFEGDAPEGVKPPVDDKAYNWHDAFTPDDTLKEGEQVKGDKDGVPGTWTFSGFTTRDKLSENGIENDMKYTGTWTFTPAEYKVAYRFDGDTPADVTAPVDEKTYKWHDGVTVDETYKEGDTITGKKDGKEFTWTFKGWKATDTLTENGIEGDVVFTGVWEYSEKLIDTPVDPQKPMGDNGILIIMAVVFAAAAAAFIVTTALKKKKAE